MAHQIGNDASARLRYFSYDHLPAGPLKDTSAKFAELAAWVEDNLPSGPERSVALRKLLEGKDCAVRAALDAPDYIPAPCPVCGPGTVLGQGCRREADCLRRPNHLHGPDCWRVI